MHRRHLLPILLFCVPQASLGQPREIPPVRYPALPTAAADAQGFIPSGWTLVARKSGDLNRDGRPDLAVLMRMTDPANVLPVPLGDRTARFDTNPHLLAVAFGKDGGGYRLAGSSHGLFPRPIQPFTGEDPPGDDTIAIERGGLLVSFQFLRGWARYRFRWERGAFRLIGYDSAGVSAGCILMTSINYLTRRASLAVGLISSDRTRVAWRRVTGRPPPTLGELDLETFIPDLTLDGPAPPCPGER